MNLQNLIIESQNLNFSEKRLLYSLRLQVSARSATMSPPLGPILGQYGINIMEFCKAFNDLTKNFFDTFVLNVNLKQFFDKTFTFHIKSPVLSFLVKELCKTLEDTDNFILKKDSISETKILSLVLYLKKYRSNFSKKNIFKSILGSLKSYKINLKL